MAGDRCVGGGDIRYVPASSLSRLRWSAAQLGVFIRDLERRFGDQVRWYDAALALFEIRLQLGTIVDYWERGPGDAVPTSESLMQNLAVFGFDLRDALSMTQATCATTIGTPHDSLIAPMISHAKERAARRVLPNSATSDWSGLSVIDAAEKLGADGASKRSSFSSVPTTRCAS